MTTIEYIPGAIVEVEESDVVLNSDRRTKPRYPSTPEQLEETLRWHREQREKRALAAAAAEESEEVAPFVAFPPVELEDPAKAPGAVGTVARRLIASGWEVRVKTNRALMPAVRYASSSEEGAEKEYSVGDVRYARYALRTYVLLGVGWNTITGRPSLIAEATWERRSKSIAFKSAVTVDPWQGREYRPTSLKPRPQREWEKKEKVTPPMGFSEWLDLMAPKPPSKTKKTKSAPEQEEQNA